MQPLISIIIVNYNGREYLDRCVNSILANSYPEYEIIIVDNGSTDGSVSYIKDKYRSQQQKIFFVELDRNYGPAKARNSGCQISRGKYIGFLDNDTIVHQEWASAAVDAFKQDDRLGIIQCKLLLAKERTKIDYVGEYIGQNGFLIQRAAACEVDSGQHDQQIAILAAKSAGMFIRKEAFDKVGGFDDDYFIYVEETDLGWRCWLAGYKVMFVPTSVVYHEFGTSSVILGKQKNNYNAKYHGSKNYIMTLIKNLDTCSLVKILPVHVILWIGLAWFTLLNGDKRAFRWIHAGIWWNMLNLVKNYQKRKQIQAKRLIDDADLFKIVMMKRSLSYFIRKATSRHKIGNAEGFIKLK